MNKILLLFLLCLNCFAGTFKLSKNELNEVNQERLKNHLSIIQNIESAEIIIQDELDKRLEQNKALLREKKALLPAMPIMEKIGAKNLEREELRRNSLKNSIEAMSQSENYKN